MDFLQNLLDNSNIPVITAFLLGLLTAISPCPLATNITAIGFISKDIGNRNKIFLGGLLYTLGRVVAYTVLGYHPDLHTERGIEYVFLTERYKRIQ